MSSSLSLKPNLSLQMGKKEDRQRFSRMVLVRNLEPLMKNSEVEPTIDFNGSKCQTEKVDQADGDHQLSRDLSLTPEAREVSACNLDQSQESRDITANSLSELSRGATLQGRPKRYFKLSRDLRFNFFCATLDIISCIMKHACHIGLQVIISIFMHLFFF